jgi:8-oxo-dGTP pyrophosphatase MutT (NUDIX family)
MTPNRSILLRMMQRYWRLTRSVTMGAQALIRDPAGRVLLVQHGYKPGWAFPGGGVEPGENALQSLLRELDEEVGVFPTTPPRLFGLYTNFDRFPGDHIALFIVDGYTQPKIPAPNREIVEQRYIDPAALPEDTTLGTRRRIAEVIGNVPIIPQW